MPPADRNNPKRSTASELHKIAVFEFFREFPDDDACLEYLWRTRYAADGEHAHCPKCGEEREFRRYEHAQQRQAWTCQGCGKHLAPTAGTIFHKSSTSLHLWFYAMYLMASTRCGISAKQLERELGVTYKTAWRMAYLIRTHLMAQMPSRGSGRGRSRRDMDRYGSLRVARDCWLHAPRRNHTAWPRDKKTNEAVVMGMVERGGRVRRDRRPVSPRPHRHQAPIQD